MPTLKLASWNINSVRARLPIVGQLIEAEAPDIICLQETKVRDSQFPHADFEEAGYVHRYLHGQPMHHGVAILSKVPLQEERRYDWQDNGEARHIGVRLPNGVLLENVYIPAGGDVPDREENPKFGQKLDFYERMIRWSEALDVPTIMMGDFNIAPLECDVWSHKQLLGVVSHTPLECETMERLRASNDWVDIGREFVAAPERLYTWWSYRAKDWRKSDRGRRLDHVWVSPELKSQVKAHRVLEDARSWDRPSDHIPLITELEL
ncbi:exodeoxyribonuclease III [Pacificimonas flava]|uniref:Exodeoxyribonuclease III n=2 Tax=Pacificimonas TaxID=1960290 RepID=A0A219B355_9SPHN|nr:MULTISPECIES: exodeoxyribonuclease III [Pacificimonas]MBZ6377537.1 exodeoxyribonuclease III [Pacificimonas aurantium]OWV32770.1 exodeoxyribonuclease III [Pacificimonas flava]